MLSLYCFLFFSLLTCFILSPLLSVDPPFNFRSFFIHLYIYTYLYLSIVIDLLYIFIYKYTSRYCFIYNSFSMSVKSASARFHSMEENDNYQWKKVPWNPKENSKQWTPTNNVTDILSKFESKRHTMTSCTSTTSSYSSSSSLSSLSLPISEDQEHKYVADKSNYAMEKIVNELLAMYQTAMDQCAAAQARIEVLETKLNSTVDVTRIRDYEIRVGYLMEKLDEISKERDKLEEEFMGYGKIAPNPISLPKHTPSEDDEQHQLKVQQESDIAQLTQQLTDCEESALKLSQKYIGDIERQRIEAKKLWQVIVKQGDLIARLETKIASLTKRSSSHTSEEKNTRTLEIADEHLLQAHIELQHSELEDKRVLLSALLSEREAWMNTMERMSSTVPTLSAAELSSPSPLTRSSQEGARSSLHATEEDNELHIYPSTSTDMIKDKYEKTKLEYCTEATYRLVIVL
ncbi:hypothetical protein BDF14DRAFT_1959042 [Spinellus fusiger]|nr:hypothetical protein BDF14DRAFT_1959042 [Spinellus fusiger]